MDDLRIYARDLATEVRRVSSVLMVAVALLFLALSASSEITADARTTAMNELREVWAVAGTGSGGRDVKTMLCVFGETSMDDLELQ